jgi:hypothetical protein
MASQLFNFESFTFEGQQHTKDFGYAHKAPFPLALKTKPDFKPTLEESVSLIKAASESGELFRLVQHHGGSVLIRGLPIETPDDYSRVAHAFGFGPHEEVGRPPIRTVLAPNVKTANEG